MSDTKLRRNAGRLAKMRRDKRRRMYTGRLLPDGTVSMAGAPTNKTWVRFSEDAREVSAAWGVLTTPSVPVIVDINLAGEQEIVGVDWRIGTTKFNAALPAVIQPPPMLDVIPGNVPTSAVTEARLQASEASDDLLKVHTCAFAFGVAQHLGGSLDGGGNFDATAYDESVAAYIPATVGTARWLRRYFDPTDASFHFAAGALEFWPSVDYLSEATLGEIAVPVGCYPAGAVALAYGQTTVRGGRFASARDFINPIFDDRLADLDSVMDDIAVDYHGDVVTDYHGNVVYSR